MKSFGRWLACRAVLCNKHRVNFWSAVMLIAWASILIWNTAPINSNFTVTLTIFDEDRLEMIALAIGCIQLVGVLSGCKWFRVIASGMAAWLLFMLGYSLAVAGAVTPGVSTYTCWGCINLHSMISVIQRKKRSET